MYGHRAKKSLGQNFLQNKGIIDKIIDAADPVADDIILEIGPGQGSITKPLLFLAGKVIAVEKDNELEAFLRKTYAEEIETGRFDLVHGDILEFDPEIIKNSPQPPLKEGEPVIKYKLVANIPYNITGAIIEKFLSASFQPEMMVLMVQKEVADRIVAKDKKTGNDGKGSILSNAIRAYGNPEYICTVKSGSFVPAPKIDSAVIRISDISRKNFLNKHHEEVFFQVLKAGFAHKRKTLSGNLKNILEPDLVEEALRVSALSATVRAEDLGIANWLSLARIVYNAQYESEYSLVV